MRVKKTHEARNKTRWALFFLPPSLALFYSHPDALQPPFSLSNLPSRSPTPLLALQPPFSLFNPPPPLPYPSFFFHPFKFTKTSQPPLHSTPSPPPPQLLPKAKKNGFQDPPRRRRRPPRRREARFAQRQVRGGAPGRRQLRGLRRQEGHLGQVRLRACGENERERGERKKND